MTRFINGKILFIQIIIYQIGNPTSYLGAALSWRGRELVKYEKGNKQISYSYDVDGMRYRKVVKINGVETARYDYVYSGGRLILLTYTSNGASNTARFIYDSLGEIRGFILDNTQAYLYLKNGQGDITGIVDESGSIILTYSYTAWGKVTYSATDMESMALAATLSNVNPFTYRGYCHDYDIGMYYLQSRYYDPNICRFINADSTDYLGNFKVETKYLKCNFDVLLESLLGYNLFSACENDAVNLTDYEGTKPKEKKPENLEKYLKREFDCKKTKWGNSRVSVVVSKNNITISANFELIDGLKEALKEEVIDRYRYKYWFTYGIQKYWKGIFRIYGYKVNLKTYATQYNGSHVDVEMYNKTGVSNTNAWSSTWYAGKNCKIKMYKKHPEDKKKYTGEQFAWVSAHEFGHLLGTGDVGEDTPNSIMGQFGNAVSSQDVRRVLLAFIRNVYQTWWNY